MSLTLKNINPETKIFALAVMAAISVLCFIPVFIWGPPVGSADLTHHIQLASNYAAGISDGTFLPDWGVAENQGYGSVAVRFYPPLTHITIGFFQLIFGRMDFAMFAAFTLWSFIGCLGMFLWTRDVVDGSLAPLAAAILFAISPYHLNQFYNAFLLGEFVSLSILPFAFLFIGRICKDGGPKNVIGLAFALAGMILSNIPQNVVCFPFLALYALFLLDRRKLLRQSFSLAASAILAALLTAFYWVRLVLEMSWIHITEPNTDPNYDFHNNFLFSTSEASAEGIGFASLMLALLIVMVVGLLVASGRYRSIRSSRTVLAAIVLLVASALMTLPLGQPIWELIPQLERVQFPWRFLSIASIAATMIMAYCIGAVDRDLLKKNRPVVLVIIGCVLILGTFSIRQVIMGADFGSAGDFNKRAENSIGAKGLYHWWPKWADKNTFKERTQVIAGDRPVDTSRWDGSAHEFSIAPGDATTVRTALLYYPWWRVEQNGKEVETRSADGALAFDLGPERAACSLKFVEPESTRIARIASALSIVGAVMFLGIIAFRRKSSYE